MTSSHSGSSDSSDSSDSSGAKGCTVLAITTTLATLNLQCQDMSSTAGVSLPSTPTQYTLPLRTSFCAHMIYVHCTSYMVSNCEGTKEYNLKLDVSWCLADLHFIPLLHQSPTFSWRWLSHATKRSTRRSKSRRDSRRPRREQKKTYRNVNVNNMEISWKNIEYYWIMWSQFIPFCLSNWKNRLYDQSSCKSQLHVSTAVQLSVQAFFSEQAPWLLHSDVTTFLWHIPPDLTRFDLECPVGRCPVGRLGIVLNQTRARCCREDPKRCDIVWSQEFPRPKVSEGKHAKLRKMLTNSSKQYNLLWCSKLQRAESHSLSCPNPGLPG